MDLEKVQKAYSRWSKVYDVVFGPAFAAARRHGIGMLDLAPGDRVLEVGVGTGLSIPMFPAGVEIVGIDISRAMLRRARGRARRRGARLLLADAGRLPFEDSCFDAVFAPYVVSAVPDPVAMLREVARVARPSASVVLLNHFASRNPVVNAVEKAVTRTTSALLGFHADFPIAPVLVQAGLDVQLSERLPPFGYWKALRVVERRSP